MTLIQTKKPPLPLKELPKVVQKEMAEFQRRILRKGGMQSMVTLGEHTDPPVGGIGCYEQVQLTIGKYCSIGSGLTILSGTHPVIEHPEAVTQYPFKEHGWGDYWPSKMGGFVTIGNDVWIATNVSILEGITIGNGAIIGAGSVVTHDVDHYTFVAGNPAVVKGYRHTFEKVKELEKIQWWLWDESKVKEAIPFMKDIDIFLSKYAIIS